MDKPKQIKPLIGITGPVKGGLGEWLFLRYKIKKAGGRPVRITAATKDSHHELDGLLLSGGGDINPERYGKPITSLRHIKKKRSRRFIEWCIYPLTTIYKRLLGVGSSEIDNERDATEFGLVAQCLNNGIPILGICRGMQLINIFMGGTLYHDIRSLELENPVNKTFRACKSINIKEGSLIEHLLGTTICQVNSLHTQAIDQLGSQINTTAKDQNGLTQAIEFQGHPFILGIQWHPEYLPFNLAQINIFSSYIQACLKNMKQEQS